VLSDHGVEERQLVPVAGGERIKLADNLFVSVFPSLHCCAWSHPTMPQADTVCLGDMGVDWHTQRERQNARADRIESCSPHVRDHIRTAHQGVRGDGGSLVYLIETPAGSLFYQDTSGYWTGTVSRLRPDVAILAAAGRGNVDAEPIQGSLAEFVAGEAALLSPQRVLLSHHDDFLPGISISVDVEPIRKEMAARLPETELVEIGYLSSYPLFG
jgi:hypothetical protein